jgi:TetR/AcrR family transcriptional regulator, transcriptional repressor of aconitase
MKEKTNLKKERIFAAALKCFMQYGYSKTTFGDIAKKAEVSRASLYLYFKNKNDLFITMNSELHSKYLITSRDIVKSKLSNKEKLAKIIDVWIIEPYRLITASPYSNGWLDELKYISVKSEMRFRALFIKSIAPLTGEDLAEIVVLSIRGLMDDRPPVKILQKRIELLTQTMAK